MFNLENFDKQIGGGILSRGKQYFNSGAVLEIEESGDGLWQAQVEGSEFYTVEISLKKNNEIKNYYCDCPYDGDICKHIIAVLFTIRDEKTIIIETAKPGKKKPGFDDLLAKITLKEYKDFIKKYAALHKDFKNEFEIAFAEKDDDIDLGKKYSDTLKKIIRKHSEQGFIGYRGSSALAKDIFNLLANVEELINKENFLDAFIITCSILKEMVETLAYCDDSNGRIGDAVAETINIIDGISIAAPVPLKEQIFNFILEELDNKIYFDYGDFGYELFAVFEDLAVKLSKSTEFLNYIETQLLKLNGRYDDYRKNFLHTKKIDFFKATGNTSEVESLIQQNLDIVEVRRGEVNKFIANKDFIKAKALINDGIALAKEKLHPGTVADWEKNLLRIAVLENDIKTIRHYTKYFAFDRGFDKQYYHQWKATFSTEEWMTIIENHLDETIKRTIKDHEKNKGKSWYNPNPPLLNVVSSIYIEEGFFERLFDLVKLEKDLDKLLYYHSDLKKHYPDKLIELYLPAFELKGDYANNRSDYADLSKKMKKVMKELPQFRDRIVTVAKMLKLKYPRRPAMIDELNKII